MAVLCAPVPPERVATPSWRDEDFPMGRSMVFTRSKVMLPEIDASDTLAVKFARLPQPGNRAAGGSARTCSRAHNSS